MILACIPSEYKPEGQGPQEWSLDVFVPWKLAARTAEPRH